MAKQPSLGDVVKQEVEKVNDLEAQSVEATVVDSATLPEKGAIKESSTAKVTETSTRRKNPTKADLEVQITELTSHITELKSILETSQENERTFQEKVLNLQSEVEEKSQLIAQLQEDLERNDLREELDKAQQTALQLSETNSKLLEEIEIIKKENEDLKNKQEHKSKPEKKGHLPQLVHRPEHVQNQPKTSSDDDFSQSTWLL